MLRATGLRTSGEPRSGGTEQESAKRIVREAFPLVEAHKAPEGALRKSVVGLSGLVCDPCRNSQ